MSRLRHRDVTERADAFRMRHALSRPPISVGPLLRTGARAVRLSAFALESWSRLLFSEAGSPRARAEELSWLAENLCALHGVRTLLRGVIPKSPCVLVANHVSYFDPVVLAAHTPLLPLAKQSVASWPLVGDACRRLGVLFVERGDPQSGARALRSALSALASGVSVLVFPEGTTTCGERVLAFKRGIFGVARRAGVPVVPVALRYERAQIAWVGDETFLPHYVRNMAHACTRVSVQYLAPLSGDRGETADGLAELARRSIARALTTRHVEAPASARPERIFLASA